jgi:anti-sigma-K factor RskA
MSQAMTPEHEHLRDDLAAYSLGALGDDEAKALEAHLAGCEPCREWLRWLRPAVDALAGSVEQHAPPESLRGRLMTAVEAEAAPPPVESRPARRRLRLGGWPLRPATALAAAALIAGGIGAGYLLRGDDDGGGSTFVEAEVPAELANTASATLERRPESATLHVHEVPALAGGKVYEVWIQREGAVEPASLFVPQRDGTALAAIDDSLAGAEAVLVTREPRGGSPQPTSSPLLRVPLS